MSEDPRLLLIGWDAADWRMIRPLMASGKMPHLQKLAESGVSGNLATLQPVLSPILWTSIATGKRAYKHGILGFIEPEPTGKGVRLVTNLSRKTKAVWNILSQSGKRCNVVGWWPSHPAEPINGVMVSNQFQTALAKYDEPWPMQPGSVHPGNLAGFLEPLRLHPLDVSGDTLIPFAPRAAEIDQNKDRRLIGLAKTIAETATVHAAATGILQLEPWDFMAVYYDGIDHFGHGFMKYHPPRREGIAEADFDFYSGVMESAYRYHDMMLGVLLELAGENTRVMLISDHGFHADHLRPQGLSSDPAGPAAEHRDYGIFVMAGPGIKQGEHIAGGTLLDIAPTVLHSFGLAVGEDMDGKVLLPVFEQPRRVERIATWDSVPGNAGTHPPGAQIDSFGNAGALRQLVDLGYIDEPNADNAIAAEEAVRELRYHLAQSYMDGRRYSEAAEIFHELWERWPDESRFGLRLLHCRFALRQTGAARDLFTLLTQRRRATAQRASVELDTFIKEKQATGLPPEDWPKADQQKTQRLQGRATVDFRALMFFEAQVFFLEENYLRAHEIFLELVASASPDRRLTLFLKLGETCTQLRHWGEARLHYESALQLDAENAAAHLGLARVLLFEKRVLEAAAHGLKAVELDYHNPRTHFFYGVALHRCRQPLWAIDSFLEAVRQAPLFPGAHRRLAGLYARILKDPEKAAHHREMALRARSAISEQGAGTAVIQQEQAAVSDTSSLVEQGRFEVRGKVGGQVEEWITVVTGLPRSGTSMMMQLLMAGGIPPFTDGKRLADQSNERGYFEMEEVKRIARDNAWMKDALGKAIKIVVPLVQYLPAGYAYKIIYVDRELDEVLASQTAMLGRLSKPTGQVSGATLSQVFSRQAARCQRVLANLPRADCLTVRYRDAVSNPEATVGRIIEFLEGANLNAQRMAGAIDLKLYRARGNQVPVALSNR